MAREPDGVESHVSSSSVVRAFSTRELKRVVIVVSCFAESTNQSLKPRSSNQKWRISLIAGSVGVLVDMSLVWGAEALVSFNVFSEGSGLNLV